MTTATVGSPHGAVGELLRSASGETEGLQPLRRQPHTSTGSARVGKLVLHFVLTRRSALGEAGFSFLRDRDLVSRHLAGVRNGVEVLSLREMSSFLWHTSNITSLLTGQLDDPRLRHSYETKRQRFLTDPFVQQHFAAVLPGESKPCGS